VADQEYTNPFVDVHRKVKAFKDRVREANQNDAELRESRSLQEAKEILDKEPRVFKDRAREANQNDAELRENRSVQEAKEIFGKEPK